LDLLKFYDSLFNFLSGFDCNGLVE